MNDKTLKCLANPTLTRNLYEYQDILNHYYDIFGIQGFNIDSSCDDAKYRIYVCTNYCHTGKQIVQIIRLPEAMRQFLNLDKLCGSVE